MKEPKPMQELHAIRRKMYEETKRLSPKERVSRMNRIAEDAIRKHGLNIRRWDHAA